MYGASRSRQKLTSSCSAQAAPGRDRIHAITSSPYLRLGTPTTCASLTAGWQARASSISRGEMFSPPRMIMSLIRPTMRT